MEWILTVLPPLQHSALSFTRHNCQNPNHKPTKCHLISSFSYRRFKVRLNGIWQCCVIFDRWKTSKLSYVQLMHMFLPLQTKFSMTF